MKDLIERLEKATEGARELDVEILMAAVPGVSRKKWSYTHLATGKVCDIDETRDASGRLIIVPHYTSSLDAAMTLVPDGRYIKMEFSRDKKRAWVWVEMDDIEAVARASPALALCIAALKAREQQQ